MRIDVITVFPGYLAPLGESLLGKAQHKGLLRVAVHDLRQWTDDPHRTVDDAPYGGGPGMVMRPEPWGRALDEVCAVAPGASSSSASPHVVVPTPAGRPFDQRLAQEYAAKPWLVFACGRYEGIDQRVFDDAEEHMSVDYVSIGDYVLCGGEVAVLAITEAVGRLIPGVLGNAESAEQDSFADGLLEGPAYTRPEIWRGRATPHVLLSGNHARIARWRRDEAVRRTAQRRPDLLAELPDTAFDEADRALLRELGVGKPGGL